MILFLNEWGKKFRYADNFDSFNKFLNKISEDERFKYIDLIDIGLEYDESSPSKYIDGLDIRFFIVEKLLKETIPNLINNDNIPIVEFKPLFDVLDEFSIEKQTYVKMLLNGFSKIAVFCGSSYEYEHFSNNCDIPQILYSGETSFFADVKKTIDEKISNDAMEKLISSIDGFGFYMSNLSIFDEDLNDRKIKIVNLLGNVGSKISFDEFIEWMVENRKEIIEEMDISLEDKQKAISMLSIIDHIMKKNDLIFVRKHHPVELIFEKVIFELRND